MPRGLTAADVIAFETDELGNDLILEPGVATETIKSERLVWLTTTKQAAKHYGYVEAVTGNFRIIARDHDDGLLVEQVPLFPDPAMGNGQLQANPRRQRAFARYE
jgi:hypothetical protein